MEEEEEEIKRNSPNSIPIHSSLSTRSLLSLSSEQAAGRSPTKPHTDDQYEY